MMSGMSPSRAFSSQRCGGRSAGPHAQYNQALHKQQATVLEHAAIRRRSRQHGCVFKANSRAESHLPAKLGANGSLVSCVRVTKLPCLASAPASVTKRAGLVPNGSCAITVQCTNVQ